MDFGSRPHKLEYGKNLEIEALRGFAILFAVFSHLGSLYFWGNSNYAKVSQYIQSWTGVDLFFCISGYVIAKSILKEIPTDRGIKSFYAFAIPFWIRRFWRVTPSAWVWLSITVLAAFTFNASGAFGTRTGNISDAIAIFFQVANVHFFMCRTGMSDICAVSEAYWSLSIEEQFYILLPFVLVLMPRRMTPLFFAAVAVSQLFIFNRWTWSPSGMIRTDGLALGVLVAFAQGSANFNLIKPTFLSRRWAAWGWATLWLLLLITVNAPILKVSPFSLGLAVLAGAILVWTCSFDAGLCFPAGTFRSLMAYIGARSYAIYLIHIPVFLFINEIAVRFDWLAKTPGKATLAWIVSFLALAMILLLAEINYRFIETPLRLYGAGVAKRFRQRAMLADETSASAFVHNDAGKNLPAPATLQKT